MRCTKTVYEVRKVYTREEADKERIIFEFNEEVEMWEYVAPNQQKHSEGQVEDILKQLKELNSDKLEKAKEE